MEKIVVKGGQRLTGRVKVEGAKNAVLPIQAASILASSGNIKLSNVPILSDVTTMNQLLRFLNIKVDFDRFSYDYPANYFEFYGICRIEEKSVVS